MLSDNLVDETNEEWNTESVNERFIPKKINKDKFCKKNKLQKNKYGSHNYRDGLCVFCNKKDPHSKIDFNIKEIIQENE